MNDENKSQEKTVKKVKTKTVKKDSRDKNISITQFADLEGKFLHIKVGNKERPADEIDIKDIRDLEKDTIGKMRTSLSLSDSVSTKNLSGVLLNLMSIEEKLELRPEDIVEKKAKKK